MFWVFGSLHQKPHVGRPPRWYGSCRIRLAIGGLAGRKCWEANGFTSSASHRITAQPSVSEHRDGTGCVGGPCDGSVFVMQVRFTFWRFFSVILGVSARFSSHTSYRKFQLCLAAPVGLARMFRRGVTSHPLSLGRANGARCHQSRYACGVNHCFLRL